MAVTKELGFRIYVVVAGMGLLSVEILDVVQVIVTVHIQLVFTKFAVVSVVVINKLYVPAAIATF